MVGLIWTVQLVHYPAMKLVGVESFKPYHQAHMRRISWIVAPVMLIELTSGVLLLLTGVTELAFLISIALLGVIWLSTAFLQVPLHRSLEQHGLASERIDALVRSNWVRTAAWSVRAILLLALLDFSN